MRCIFCKNDSSNSKSVEHIIPESLWNTKQVLPPGVVCDKCNNYFSRKVEKPFLCSPIIEALRFHQAIPSKKGKIPSVKAMMSGLTKPVELQRSLSGDLSLYVDLDPSQFDQLSAKKRGTIIYPIGNGLPNEKIVSRFLSKVALEAMAQRLVGSNGGIEYIVDESQLDEIRNHARLGTTKSWPYSSRRIYNADKEWDKGSAKEGQIVHEFDFLVTEQQEWYFVLALYGLELAINMGGPEIEGYEHWIESHEHISPLYYGKNKNC